MHRYLIALLALFLALNTHAKTLSIVTTTADLASITREVTGDRATVTSIARGFQDPHFVEPKPSFLLLLRKADLLIIVGREMEIGWLPPLLDQSRNANIRPGGPGYLDASTGAEILDRPTGAVNRSMGDIHALGNPHYWLDPANAVRIAIQVQKKVAALQPENAAFYAAQMTAMDAATRNSGEMIESLTLYMNKVRQAAITREIIEVVSGAQAL